MRIVDLSTANLKFRKFLWNKKVSFKIFHKFSVNNFFKGKEEIRAFKIAIFFFSKVLKQSDSSGKFLDQPQSHLG